MKKSVRSAWLKAAIGAGAVLFLASLFLLVRAVNRYRATGKALKAKQRELQAYYLRDPFPTAANVELKRRQVDAFVAETRRTRRLLAEANIEPQVIEPAEFIARFWAAVGRDRELPALASQNSVRLDPGFSFGFERYGKGTLPDKKAVGRLSRQFEIVRRLSAIIFEAGITHLQGIERDEFEAESGSSARSPRRGARRDGRDAGAGPRADAEEEEALMDVERFTLRFQARERALLAVLNALARNRDFHLVVASLSIAGDPGGGIDLGAMARVQPRGEEEPPVGPLPVGPSRAAPAEGRPRTVIVCGNELSPAAVVMVVDVCGFNPPREAERAN